MKFAHMADVHIGAWRDPKMADLPDKAFAEAMSIALAEKVDFVLVAGDLFHTALPGIDHLKATVKTLQLAKDALVPVYCIPGSHDFSPSGKSMLHVLEEAGLLVNVFRGSIVDKKLQLEVVVDKKTNTVFSGILGLRGMLDKKQYEMLDKDFLSSQLDGFAHKIFLFHTSLEELRPAHLSGMDAAPMSLLPEGFEYYAGGHVHVVKAVNRNPNTGNGVSPVVYPGPVFPASFSELELLQSGKMVIVDNGKVEHVSLDLKKVVCVSVSVVDKTPREVHDACVSALEKEDLDDSIVLLRVSGSLSEGSVGDIDVTSLVSFAYGKGAYFFMRNTVKLQSALSLEVAVEQSVHHIEDDIISESVGKVATPFADREKEVVASLLKVLSAEKVEGETVSSFDARVLEDAKRTLGLD